MEIIKLESDREKIGKRLKKARQLAGLSQAQCSELSGIQRPTISEIEAGRRKVSAEEIILFADLYKVQSSWLLLEDDTDNYLFAARELEKLDKEDMKKVFDIIKILRS